MGATILPNIKLYTHVMWGGVFQIDDRGILRQVVEKPQEWREMQRMGWGVGHDVLQGDEDMTEHFKELRLGNIIHGEADYFYLGTTKPWKESDGARYTQTW